VREGLSVIFAALTLEFCTLPGGAGFSLWLLWHLGVDHQQGYSNTLLDPSGSPMKYSPAFRNLQFQYNWLYLEISDFPKTCWIDWLVDWLGSGSIYRSIYRSICSCATYLKYVLAHKNFDRPIAAVIWTAPPDSIQWEPERTRKVEENEPNLNFLSQMVQKWGPVEVNG
jgi:hypothetical protein